MWNLSKVGASHNCTGNLAPTKRKALPNSANAHFSIEFKPQRLMHSVDEIEPGVEIHKTS